MPKKAEAAPRGEKSQQAMLQRIKTLYTHPRHSRIQAMPGGGFLVTEEEGTRQGMYPGLLDRVQAVFHRSYSLNPWSRSHQQAARERSRSATGVPYFVGAAKRRAEELSTKDDHEDCTLHGADHGSAVHQQMELWTKCVKLHGLQEGTRELLRLTQGHLDPCTKRLIMRFREWGWVPVDAERCIFDEKWRLGTRVDLFAVEMHTKKLLLLELKTGYEDEPYGPRKSDPPLSAPLHHVRRCPQNIHQLQLLSMMLICRRKYKGLQVQDGYVVRALPKAKDVVRVPLQKWARDRMTQENVYESLCYRKAGSSPAAKRVKAAKKYLRKKRGR